MHPPCAPNRPHLRTGVHTSSNLGRTSVELQGCYYEATNQPRASHHAASHPTPLTSSPCRFCGRMCRPRGHIRDVSQGARRGLFLWFILNKRRGPNAIKKSTNKAVRVLGIHLFMTRCARKLLAVGTDHEANDRIRSKIRFRASSGRWSGSRTIINPQHSPKLTC